MGKVLISQILLLIGSISFSYAGIFLSTDIPVDTEYHSYEDRDVAYYEPSFFRFYLSGQAMGISEGLNIDAFDFYGNDILFSVDIPLNLDGKSYSERDIILYNGINFSKLINGADVGIPQGARIDAATVLPDGKIIFSLDIPVVIDNLTFKPTDLIIYDGVSVDLYFNGIVSGLPESANLDGVWVNSEGSILFSIDIPAVINGLSVTDKDFIEWNGSSFFLPFADISVNLPQGVDIDALAVADWCHGDYDNDSDVDGSDLAVYISDSQGLLLETFAVNFGRTYCP
ncbi:MAG: hypothetical protein DRH34_03735 [Deltaproteobacteria bacterium]|nr:MAG: hypothetical protein DRH34_03735 [Deltaproteobacteria bacterium]RLC15925.1 MAG: hypothetical protein DRH93_19235 [Deltaproteobacteria bacterium]